MMRIAMSLFVSLWLMSCASQQPGFDLYDDDSNWNYSNCSDDAFAMEITFIGSTDYYHIFETQITNVAHTSRALTTDNLSLDIWEGRVIKAFDPSILLEELSLERKELKKEKKKRNIFNIVISGIDLIATAGQGASIGQTLLFGTESALYIIDDNLFMQRGIESFEDEMKYIDDMVLDSVHIFPDETIKFDVLFPSEPITSGFSVQIRHDRKDLECEFIPEMR